MSIFVQCETVRERQKALKFCGVSCYGLKWPIVNKGKLKYFGRLTTSSQNTARRNAGKERGLRYQSYFCSVNGFSPTRMRVRNGGMFVLPPEMIASCQERNANPVQAMN